MSKKSAIKMIALASAGALISLISYVVGSSENRYISYESCEERIDKEATEPDEEIAQDTQ